MGKFVDAFKNVGDALKDSKLGDAVDYFGDLDLIKRLNDKIQESRIANSRFVKKVEAIMNSKAMQILIPVATILAGGLAAASLKVIIQTAIKQTAKQASKKVAKNQAAKGVVLAGQAAKNEATLGSITGQALFAAYQAHSVVKAGKAAVTLKDLEEEDKIREGIDQMLDVIRRQDLPEGGPLAPNWGSVSGSGSGSGSGPTGFPLGIPIPKPGFPLGIPIPKPKPGSGSVGGSSIKNLSQLEQDILKVQNLITAESYLPWEQMREGTTEARNGGWAGPDGAPVPWDDWNYPRPGGVAPPPPWDPDSWEERPKDIPGRNVPQKSKFEQSIVKVSKQVVADKWKPWKKLQPNKASKPTTRPVRPPIIGYNPAVTGAYNKLVQKLPIEIESLPWIGDI